ncbi:potential tRNA 3' processing endoribonuclease [Pseudozyma hubeiensis SY62]|uniref:ribonuclease Z n=1 Tax=Pseudozyma hubeiensis (strain SY62) TaxID=1305764 RepID=R9PLY9_PSEHS|nr:potential tRNA 3' processing endoribonuclease [Pseudozyma hubeiensis SY62]GAC99145.1 potential tRNA 3' processing endoribonuclease [Pseudozyma hubeiensis SY62]
MLADLRVLHVPSSDTNVLPPVILQLGADRYLFNVGEGTSRSSTQRKANLSRVSNIFVSRVGWEAIGGLPGVLMSMADGQRSSESLHGPDGLRYALATMRTYAKRDIMKLNINEIETQSGLPNADTEARTAPIFTDDNLAVYAVPLHPASALQRAAKKPKLDDASNMHVPTDILDKIDQSWRRPYFNPTSLQGAEAQAWIRLVSDSIFNDSLLRKRQQQSAGMSENVAEPVPAPKLTSSIDDVEMEEAEQPRSSSSNRNRVPSPWRPPLSPAFVTRLLPRPHSDTRNVSAVRADPAEGGQAPLVAFICEAHPQRGKFDPVKAADAGVAPGPSFAALTRGEDVTLERPVSWSAMQTDERKKWIQSQRGTQRGANGSAGSSQKQNGKQNGKAQGKGMSASSPAAWSDLEQVKIKSNDVVGPSRAGAVVFHIYLPSIDYLDSLLSEGTSLAFSPYTARASQQLSKEQSRTPHAIVHAVPVDVLRDPRYQTWMRQFGPDCHHIIANQDVCANMLMFPSSATIPLRLSQLDDVMFKVPQYQLAPRVPVSALSKEMASGTTGKSDAPLRLVAAEADLVIPLQPRGEPKHYQSGAPDFDFAIQSEQAHKLAAFEFDDVEESEQQMQQLAKAKAKAKNNTKSGVTPSIDAAADSVGAVRNIRLREARKQAWQVFLDVVNKIKSNSAVGSMSIPPEKDILVTTLGTGSAAPSKYRNVISTLIQTPSSGTILLDAGESTYGLLRRKFGCRRDGTAAESGALLPQDVDDILREMRVLFISHIHADHHIGLIRLLLERRKLQPRPDQPLYLVGTGFVHNYLEEYEQIEKLGLDEDVIFVLNDHLDHHTGVDPNPSGDDVPSAAAVNGHSRGQQEARQQHLAHVQAIKKLTGLSHIHTARVIHRGSHCYGLVVRHSTEKWSVAYSGDTRPAPELIAAGKGCTLLIHEATLEDGELEMAIGKGHSTFGEAIRVGHEMGAQNILLTHFSQRYPKMARSSLFALSEQGEKDGKNVPIALAFDMVTYPLSQFEKIQNYTPAMEALFAADTEGDEEDQSVAAGEDVGTINAKAAASNKGQEQRKQSNKKQSSTGNANGSSRAAASVAAGTLGVVAATDESAAKSTEAQVAKTDTDNPLRYDDSQRSTARYIRKGMKPCEWRYIGLRLSPSPSSSSLPTVLPTLVLQIVQTAQTATLGNMGGAYNIDILSTHASAADGGKSWDAVLRVDAKHGQDLATCLSMLPSPKLQDQNVRLRIVGPTSAIQTVQNLLT